MSRFLVILFLVGFMVSCTKDHFSPDIHDTSLLPDRKDYISEDYGTQQYAKEMAGVYDSEIGLVYYDNETRTIPQLYLTRGPKDIYIDSIGSGAVYIHYDRFNTSLMPLQMSLKIKSLLTITVDTIYLKGTDGQVRTSDPDATIGTPFPESDDAELVGKYARATGELTLFIDPMLPVPVKANTKGIKK